MDIKACNKKGGIWDGRNQICKPPKNIKIFAIEATVSYGKFLHIVRAVDEKQAIELYKKHCPESAQGDYETHRIKTTGFPKYLMYGGTRE